MRYLKEQLQTILLAVSLIGCGDQPTASSESNSIVPLADVCRGASKPTSSDPHEKIDAVYLRLDENNEAILRTYRFDATYASLGDLEHAFAIHKPVSKI
jgi:hypothetical protein